MALFLSAIDPRVQEELYRRQDMKKEGDSYKLEPTRAGNVEKGGLYNRSTWIRITPNSISSMEKRS